MLKKIIRHNGGLSIFVIYVVKSLSEKARIDPLYRAKEEVEKDDEQDEQILNLANVHIICDFVCYLFTVNNTIIGLANSNAFNVSQKYIP